MKDWKHSEGYEAERAWEHFPRLRILRAHHDDRRVLLASIHRESGKQVVSAIDLAHLADLIANQGLAEPEAVAKILDLFVGRLLTAAQTVQSMAAEGPPKEAANAQGTRSTSDAPQERD